MAGSHLSVHWLDSAPVKCNRSKLRCEAGLGKFACLALLLSVWLFTPACGYRLKVPANPLFVRSNGIFVPVFTNESDEVGAERVFTDALIREIQQRSDIVLADRETGSAELRGKIQAIDYSSTSSSALGFKGLQSYRRVPTEMGVRVTLVLSLFETGTDRKLWEKSFFGFRRVNAPLNRTSNYQAPSHVGPYTQSLIESLYYDIARDIMRDVYDEMMETL